jgi:hypothetical protein
MKTSDLKDVLPIGVILQAPNLVLEGLNLQKQRPPTSHYVKPHGRIANVNPDPSRLARPWSQTGKGTTAYCMIWGACPRH